MKNEAVYKKRLLKLADFLETVPRKQFDFGTWVEEDCKDAKSLSCGTKACAIGWAATMPAFRRLGLRIEVDEGYCPTVRLNGKGGPFDAAEDLFGLTYDEVEKLFVPGNDGSPGYDATPKQVAKHIRKFVAAQP